MSSQARPSGKSPVARAVFWPAAITVLVFVTFAMIAPDAAESLFQNIQDTVVRWFSWYYVLIAAFFVAFCLYVGFSKYGDIKLGNDDDEPEFSNMSWLALLFAAGMGIGLVFYGVSEPLSHYASPRPGVTGTPEELAGYALRQTYLHWGVSAWAIYVVVGLALAYAIHRRKRPISIRWALEPLLGRERVEGRWGNTIDAIALVGTIFGVATSLGLGVMQIASGLGYIGIAEPSTTLEIVLIAIITCFVIYSVVSGVSKGMKYLSNINLVLAALVLMFVLFSGPTVFLLREFVQSLGGYLQTFIGQAFTVSAFQGEAGEEWQGAWTTFYWGWWMSWAPFVGVFIARVSKGRTVKEFVTGVLLVPTLMTFLWFSVLGGTGIYFELTGRAELINADGSVNVEESLFALLNHLPGTTFLTIGVVVLIAIFFVTSADSGALVMAMIASGGQEEPPRWLKVSFACMSSLLAIALLLAGGLDALKTAAILIALPFSFVMLLLCWSLVTAFNREIRAYQKAQRRAFRDHIGEYYGLEVESSPPAFHLPKVRWPHPKRPGQRSAQPPAIMPEAPAITSPTGASNSNDHPETQRTDN
ncbi:BCCT family transporter [Populibacterium corticicola]|uniref:BCCT family transporter n=1 Tax=Populibacterium corticicola TaxID=1812826 RepID=A0ABW5XF52_9MICO